MDHQIAPWRTAKGQTAWLSALIEAMERFSRPEWRGRPVDRLELALLRARLRRPARHPYAADHGRRRLNSN